MKRLVKKDSVEIRDHVIPTTPLYNPLGKGEDNSEFKETDNKSYEKMFNENTMRLIKEREEHEEHNRHK